MAAAQIRKTLVPLFALVVLAALVMVVLSNSRPRQKESTSQVKQEQPTALVEKNERNRLESAAYTDDNRLKYHGKLTRRARELNSDVVLTVMDSFTVLPVFPDVPAARLLKESLVAIRGQVENKQSFLTEDEATIFTEYEVLVTDVFKSDEGLVSDGDTVFITKPGGSVSYEGHILREDHSNFRPLEAGADCLFFLKKSNAQGTYSLFQAISIRGEALVTHVENPALRSTTLREALVEIRAELKGGKKQ